MLPHTEFISLAWLYIAITLGLVLNRLYVRTTRSTNNRALSNWSDVLVVAAWLFSTFHTICDTFMYAKDVLVIKDMFAYFRTSTPSPEELRRLYIFTEVYYVAVVIFYIPLYCIKGAILCFLLSVTPPCLWNIRRAIWVGVFFSAAGLLFSIFVFTIDYHWRPNVMKGEAFRSKYCGVSFGTGVAALAIHMFTDLYIYAIPFFLICKLENIPRSQKIASSIMFGMCFLLVAVAFPQAGIFNGILCSFYWSIHQHALAITVACLPALRVSLGLLVEAKERGSWRNFGGSQVSIREVADCRTPESPSGSDPSLVNKARPSPVAYVVHSGAQCVGITT